VISRPMKLPGACVARYERADPDRDEHGNSDGQKRQQPARKVRRIRGPRPSMSLRPKP
jgi:hypothetical protein